MWKALYLWRVNPLHCVLHLRDLVAIIAVLEFNQWFTKLSSKDYKLVSGHFLKILSFFAVICQLQRCSYLCVAILVCMM